MNRDVHRLSRLDAALYWVREVGLPVFPVLATKRPLTKHGFKDATRDEETIRTWWLWYPTANPGIATGAGSVVAVDFDNLAAFQAFREIAAGQPLGGLAIETGRGAQLWWWAPEADDIPKRERWLGVPGLDVCGRGASTIAPGAWHWNGRPYRILGGAIEPLPEWLHEELREQRPAPRAFGPRRPACKGEGTPFGLAVLRRECRQLAATPEGGRNRKLNLVAFLAGRLIAGGELDEPHAVDKIVRAAREAGLDDREIIGRNHEGGTLYSGLRAGLGQPMSEADAPMSMPEKQIRLIMQDLEADRLPAKGTRS